MKKKTRFLLVGLWIVLTGVCSASAYESSSRLKALEEFDVNKNAYRLLRTKSCPGCYLVNAKLSKMDLSHADLRNANLIGATLIQATLVGARLDGAKMAGANFSGAQWIDGTICIDGSIGQCVRPSTE